MVMTLISSFLVGGNNSLVALGILFATNIIKRRYARYIVSTSMFIGAVVGGFTMKESVSKLLLVRDSSGNIILILLSVIISSLLIFLYLNYIGVPSSFSQMVILPVFILGFISGIGINLQYFILLLISWVLSPLIPYTFSPIIYKFFKNRLAIKDIIVYIRILKIIILPSSILLSIAIGGNVIGLIISLSSIINYFSILLIIIYALASFLGVLVFSGSAVFIGFRVARLGYVSVSSFLLSSGIVIEAFTILGIPVSIAQTMLGGLLGFSMWGSRRISKMLASWFISPFLCTFSSLAIYTILYNLKVA